MCNIVIFAFSFRYCSPLKITHNNTEFIQIVMTSKARYALNAIIVLVAILCVPGVRRDPVLFLVALLALLVFGGIYLWKRKKPEKIIFDRQKEELSFKKHQLSCSEIQTVELVYGHNIGEGGGKTYLNLKGNDWEDILLYSNSYGPKEPEELYNFLERVLPMHIQFEMRDKIL